MDKAEGTNVADVVSLLCLFLIWGAPYQVMVMGLNNPASAAIYWISLGAVFGIMRLQADCGIFLRVLNMLTMWCVGVMGCLGMIMSVFMLPAAIITFSARGALFGRETDAATMVFCFFLPAAAMLFVACRWIDEECRY